MRNTEIKGTRAGPFLGKEAIMVLELDKREKEVLKRALETFEDELRDEIVKTDNRQWRSALHDEETIVKKILEKVSMS